MDLEEVDLVASVDRGMVDRDCCPRVASFLLPAYEQHSPLHTHHVSLVGRRDHT